MNRDAFRALAGRMWEDIPEANRVGVEALVVEDEALPHPEFADVFTLGECVTEVWPGGYGDDVRSELVLYHGSFRALSDLDSAFDWQEEMWETILHELLHHREAAAGQSGLEDFDWAEEQNRRRIAGREFDPGFYRVVPKGPDGIVRLDSQLFIEASLGPDDAEAAFEWRGHAYNVRVPAGAALAFVEVINLAAGRLCIVARRRRPWWRLWGRRDRRPIELWASALPVPGGGA